MAIPETTADRAGLLERYSLEITLKDLPSLHEARALIPDGTQVSITFLTGEGAQARIAAAAAVRRLGLVPVPHISARRLPGAEALDRFLAGLAAEAAVDRVFVIAGDCDRAEGPFEDALAVIRQGRLVEHGIRHVGIGGYPEGHPRIPQAALWQALADKTQALAEMGLGCEIVTQFAFDADPVLGWLGRLRQRGIAAPVRVGLPGPAHVGTLLRFAARCGVGASAKVMAKYGASITRVLATAGPDRLADDLARGLSPDTHADVRVHLYPFGGLARAAEWARTYAAR